MKRFFSIIALLIVFLVHAGVRDFTLKRYGIDQDFEGIFIYDIVQDEDGFLWIASDDGLYKFDGLKMTNLSKVDTTMDELITASVVSSDGHLYLGYFTGGISVVEHGRYRKLIQPEDLPGNVVKMRLDEKGVIWALTQNGILVSIDGDKIQYTTIDLLGEMVSNDFIFHHEWLYIGTSEGLVRFQQTDGIFHINGFVLGVESIKVNSLYEDPFKDKVLWVGTSDGLFEVRHGDDENLEAVGGTEHFNITTIAKDHLETLWVGTSFHGLVEVDLLNNEVHKITYFNKSTGFPSDQINSIYVDRENEIWIGSFGNGLIQLNRAFFHHYELSKSKKIQGINAVVQISEDLFFFGTESGLVKAYNLPSKDSLNFDILNFGRHLEVTALLRHKELVWVGTKSHGLFSYDFLANKLTPLPFRDFIGNKEIRCIAEGENSTLWISVAGHGVFQISKTGEILNELNTRNGFYHNEIFSILTDTEHNVWFGSYGAGLALLPKNGEMQYLTRDGIFPARDINTLKQDAEGAIWIATTLGAYGYDGEEFISYRQTDGLLSDHCNSLEIDNAGQVWIGHRKGLSLIQSEYGIIRRFNHPAELGETESVINAVLKDNQGNIWFGNPYGTTKVILPHIQHKIAQRKTHILDMRLFYDQVDLLTFSKQEKLDNILPNDLRFPHDQNHITFDYISVNLKNPEGIYYMYKLEGFDDEWSPITRKTEAIYNNLDPGSYSFLVKESDHPERWAEEYEQVSFRIRNPYWESWWFYLAQLALIAGLVFITAKLSKRLHSLFWVRIMIYVSLFMVFEYVHTELEPYIEQLSGEASIYEVVLNLVLALMLLPLELRLAKYLKKRREKYGLSTNNITVHS